MTEEKEKLLIIITHGKNNLERDAIPFATANAALAIDAEVSIYLMFDAVELAKKGSLDEIKLPPHLPLPDLPKLFTDFLSLGEKIFLCSPCCGERGIKQEDVVEGAVISGATNLVNLALESSVLSF